MNARLLDGRAPARAVEAELAERVRKLKERGVQPALGVLLVGDHAPSLVYVRNKSAAAKRIGITAHVVRLPAAVAPSEVESRIDCWNADPAVHGILVQLPLPGSLSADGVLRRIAPKKDLDCLHPENLGLLAAGTPSVLPPTAAAVRELLAWHGVALAGRHVVIVGRSVLVGRPLALLLLQRGKGADATVTVCHSRTRDLPSITRAADVLVVAVNRPRFLTGDFVKHGAAVMDVGAHQTASGWVGDTDRTSVSRVASFLSPVPGGVGPLTVVMLLRNLVQGAEESVPGSPVYVPAGLRDQVPLRSA